jgi:hypothetical protein
MLRDKVGRFLVVVLPALGLILPAATGSLMADSSVPGQTEYTTPRPGSGAPALRLLEDNTAWQAEFGPQGTDGDVHAFAHYGGEVVLGGQFSWVGNENVRNIARWNEETWLDLGAGIGGDSESEILALIEHGGVLIAGGSFTEAGDTPAANIALWDGESWHPLGSGMNGRVSALSIHDGLLIAGGDFTMAGGVEADYLAAWDGAAWHPYAPGLDGEVLTLATYAGKLTAGGRFLQAGAVEVNHIASWDGAAWQAFGSGMDDDVQALVVYSGDLFAGGVFMEAGEVTSPRFAHWDGASWVSIGFLAFTEGNRRFNTMVVYNGDLIVGGSFTFGEQFRGRGDYIPSNVLRWDGGSDWIDMNSGLNGEVYTLAVCDGQLLAGGVFTRTGRHNVASRVAAWNEDGWAWHHLGQGTEIGPVVYALSQYEGELIAGGSMRAAGDELVGCFARWDGEQWTGFGGVTDGPVLTLLPYNSDLILGGSFYWVAGEVPCQGIGRWDGSDWHTLGDGLEYYPAYGPQVRVLCEWQGDLVVGGRFFGAVGVPSPNVIRWDGIEWHPMGGGLPHTAYGMTLFENDVVAAHDHDGGHVCRWQDDTWGTMGEPFDGTIRALAVYNGDLIAGGDFTHNGNTEIEGVARWDGEAWVPFDSSPGNAVWAFEVHGESLIAAGDFPGGVLSWNGSAWSGLGTGMAPDTRVCAALSLGGGTDLYLGGEFQYSGDKVAYNVAHWRPSATAVYEPPLPKLACRLLAVSPNPFTEQTVLLFSAPQTRERVLLTIHDLGGRRVRTVLDGVIRNAGSAVWDGKTSRGLLLPAGVYYGRLRVGAQVDSRRIVLMR